ncbi:MAG TPA: hypothetical protein VH475_15160 [Tepidisphaeraceae bacterium]|jgi:hypothetical protein
MKRHIVRAAAAGMAAAAAVAGITGCGSKPQQATQSASAAGAQGQAPLVETHPVTTRPAPPTTAEASIGTPEALALKFQNWAREMEPQMSKRSRKSGEPSAVDFLEPDDFRIGPAIAPGSKDDLKVQVVPISNPVIESTASLPNQGATIATAAGRPAGADGANVARVFADSPGHARAAAPQSPRDNALSAGDLELSLSKNLKQYPKDLWAQLDFQLLQFLKDRPTPQLELMSSLPNEDRELIASVMDALTNFRNALRADGNMLMSRKVRPLLDLADRVRAQADLVIPTLALCTEVKGFGVYEPIEPARFTAMKEHPVVVYCEVENFASQQNAKRMWETRLSQEVVLYTETGLPVWQDKTESIPDLARNRRHDFFVVKKTKFPGNISIGRYLLKVTIVDQQASRVAEATIPVQFVAQ